MVGMGGIASHMLPFLQQKPWYETTAVLDINDESLARARILLTDLPADAFYTSLDEALQKSGANVAFINTPSQLHYEQAKAALEAGLHVMVAKPITNNYEQATELVEIAKAKKLTLCVGQQVRYHRHYRAVRRFLETGQLGSVEMINFFNSKPRHQPFNLGDMDHPGLYELSCHHFDSLMSLTPGQIPESIFCDGFCPSWSVYSGLCSINALIRFTNGLHVTYQGSFSAQAYNYELRLEGSNGALRCQGQHMSIDEPMTHEFAARASSFAPTGVDQQIPIEAPFLMFFDKWYEYLQGGAEPSFSGRNNLKVFALLSAGIDSIASGQPIAVADNPRYAAAFDAGTEWTRGNDNQPFA